MTKSIVRSLAIAMVLLFGAPVSAAEPAHNAVFTQGEAAIIRAYFEDQGAVRPERGKKAKGLPPGIARNLQRGKALPPGIAKQALPQGLIELLPPPPRGYERVVLSGKVLLVEIATQVIRDVLEDVIIG